MTIAPRTIGDRQSPLMTTEEVAARLQLNVQTVRKMIAEGRLKAINIHHGKRRPLYRITQEDFEAFCAGVQAAPPPAVEEFV